jgi:hypothetical protein
MTMLAMWLDKKCVALATDSKMTGTSAEVPKLHLVQPDRVMFGIGFGEGAFNWLVECPHYREPYPEYWRDCSGAESVDELEQFIRYDLEAGEFPQEATLQLWLAGVNEQSVLKAFILNGAGRRERELTPGSVIFNSTVIQSVNSPQVQLLGSIDARHLEPAKTFQTLKQEMDDKHIEFSGAKALEEISKQLIAVFEESNHPFIGGPLKYHVIYAPQVRVLK